ncbi:hypothetical protein PHYSODRAFT_530489, partial [Phytophthora sojae]
KVRELKMKLSPAARNWRGQLEKHVQSNRKRFVQEFRRKYLKLRTSESERYYTMRQKTSETPMEFFYRLSEAAVKAGIKYRKSKKERKQHVKRFLKNLRDSQLKAILANQKIRSLDDLEDILEQQEDLNLDGGYDTPPPRRDYRAGNIQDSRFKPRRRAFVATSDGESGYESEGRVRFEDEVEEAKLPQAESKEPSRRAPAEVAPSAPTVAQIPEPELRQAIFKAIEQSGWRPPTQGDSHPGWQSPRPGWQSPRPGWQSPRRENPDRNEFCEKCLKFGHKEQNCWTEIVCDRCNRKGHPGYACRVKPCLRCGKIHEGTCGDYDALEAVKKLARKGMLQDLPPPLRKQLLGEEANPGSPLN